MTITKLTRAAARRPKRLRHRGSSGRPHLNTDVTDTRGMTPREAHRAEMADRAIRREHRQARSAFDAPAVVPAAEEHRRRRPRNDKDAQARAEEKRQYRAARNVRNACRGGWS